jgi:preprotein translocase subunit Sss1
MKSKARGLMMGLLSGAIGWLIYLVMIWIWGQ